jgi:hypothetical protein
VKTMKKRKKKTRLVKSFTKALLQDAARNAEKWDYNRQLDLDAIDTLPYARFPIVFTLLHHHRHNVLAKPHMRAMVEMGARRGFAFVDMPLAFWNAVPHARMSA